MRSARSVGTALRLVPIALLAVACSSEAAKKSASESEETAEPSAKPKKKARHEGSSSAVASGAAAPTTSATATAAAWPPPGTVAIAGGTIQAHDLNDHLFPITVEPFAMDAREVTVREYKACVASGKCKALEDISLNKGGCSYQQPDRDDHPINCTWPPEASAYCASVGKRLPSAAEWQLAASGGGKRKFPWGDTMPTKDTACFRHTDGTCPVGAHPLGNTPDGVQDLGGNVAEVVADPGCLGTPPAGTACLQPFVHTSGGAWNSFESEALEAMNLGQTIGRPPESIGFRCVASQSGKPPQLLPGK